MRLRLLVIFLALLATAVACGDGDETGLPGVTIDVHAHLDEWSVKLEPASIAKSGRVTFEAHNHGKVPHQLVVIKTDLNPADLPLERVAVDVEAAGEQLLSVDVPAADGEAGRQVSATELDPGEYAIICNIPGHYQQGMYASFEVTEAPQS